MRNYLMMQSNLREQQAEAEYYRRLAEQTENQKILIHDIKNHLQTIAGLSEDGGESKIHEYVQQLMGDAGDEIFGDLFVVSRC